MTQPPTPQVNLLSPQAAAEQATHPNAIEKIAASPCPLMVIDLRGAQRIDIDGARLDALIEALGGGPWVTVGCLDADVDGGLLALADRCDVAIGHNTGLTSVIDVDVDAGLAELAACIADSPAASVALVQLLRLTADAPVEQALHAESITYGLLQTSDRFQTWLATRSARTAEPPTQAPRVVTASNGSLLRISLDRAERRNALDTAMRDQLAEALLLLDLDRSLDGALLTGNGMNFCSGGDLDEFGTTPSPAIGHHVRMTRSLPRIVHRVRDRLRVHVHGPCVGAGIELPAFAHDIVAHPDASFRLPEVGYGLVPGAGGTVSITRRCGRHHTAWLALTGRTIDASTARAWHLVDRIDASAFD